MFPSGARTNRTFAFRRKPAGLVAGARFAVESLERRMLLSAGDLEPTFGTGGKVLLPASAGSTGYQVNAVVVQADDRIVIAGSASSSANANISDFFLERLNTNGSIDTSFGSAGIVTTSFGGFGQAIAVALQPDGKLVVGGYVQDTPNDVFGTGGHSEFALARYNTNGSLDASFGSGGKVLTNIPGKEDLQSIALAPNGDILAAGLGTYQDPSHPTDPNYSAPVVEVARYTPNGTLDPTFNGVGYVLRQLDTDAGAFNLGSAAVAVQPDGKVLVGSSFKIDFAVWRFNADGSLDTSFGLNGMATTPAPDLSGGYGSVSRMLVQPDGKVLIAGPEFLDEGDGFAWGMSRYNPDGSIDSAFGTDGLVPVDPQAPVDGASGNLGGLALESDGKIVLGGVLPNSSFSPAGEFGASRYLPSGTIDPTFNTGAIQFPSNGTAVTGAMALAPDGKIVIAGSVSEFPNAFIGVVRLQNDAPTGPTPYLFHPFNTSTDLINAVNFDNGGEGVSYHDTTPQNLGGAYRVTSVDIGAESSATNGYFVGWTAPGEWLDYTIDVPASGTATLFARVASFQQGGTFHMEIDGVNETGEMTIPNSGPWDTWTVITSHPFALSAGIHVMRIQEDQGEFYGTIGDLDWFSIGVTPSATPAAAAQASTVTPGAIDRTFGFQGRMVISDLGPVELPTTLQHRVKAVAVQSDGKIVLAGSIGTNADNGVGEFWLERLNTDGSVDTSFGTNGTVITAIGPVSFATSVLVLPDGEIVAGGATEDSATAPTKASFAMARYNSNGSLNTSFGTGGTLVTSFPGNQEIDSLALSPSGGVVAAGSYFLYPNVGFDVAIYSSEGLAEEFSYGLGETGSDSFRTGVAVQADGKILIGSHTGNEFALYRFNNGAGSIDTSFGSSGVATTQGADNSTIAATPSGDIAGAVTAVAIEPDGKILVAGQTPTAQLQYALVRFTANGSLDSTFGTRGVVLTEPSGYSGQQPIYSPAGLLLQPDGKIVLAGTEQSPSDYTGSQVLLRRFLANGTLDSTFQSDQDPMFFPPPPLKGTVAEGAALASDGTIVLAADAWADTTANAPHVVGVARYQDNSAYVVTSLADDNSPGTLRWEIEAANASSIPVTITFAPSLQGTITLLQGELDITNTAAPVTIDGPGAGTITVSGNQSSSIFYIDSQVTAEIEGLSVTDGGPLTSFNGAIVNSFAGSLTLDGVTVSGNQAPASPSTYSAAIRNSFSELTIINSDISNNNCLGISDFQGEVSIVDSTISNNTAGGFYSTFGTFSFNNVAVVNNPGLGIFDDGTMTITNSNISGNHAGGIYADGSDLRVIDTTVSGNANGGIGLSTCGLTLVDSTVSDNNGSGISTDSGMTIVNSTIAGNSAGDGEGGGIDYFSTLGLPLVLITNSTIVDNTAATGGGIDTQPAATTLNNTIVAGNVTPTGAPSDIFPNTLFGETGPLSGSNNLIGPGGSGGLVNGQNGNIVGVANPGLAPLGNYGGPTLTIALLAGSPALDHGSNALAVDASGKPLTTDQRGFARIFNGTVDIGAYEAQPPAVPGDVNHDGTVNFSDLVILAQHYGQSDVPLWEDGDLNGDGRVNFADLVLLSQNYNGAVSALAALFAASKIKAR